MNQWQLEQLLGDIESDRVEFTRSLTDTEKFSEAICAFANDFSQSGKPGYLFLGTNPDGTASGAVIDDALLQNLAAIRSDGHIQPLPAMTVEKWRLRGGDMAVVEVQPADFPPVRYKSRVGPRRAYATAAEERILTERQTDRARTWDMRPCREATLSVLTLDLFALIYRPAAISWDVIEENDRPLEQQLASLRFYDLRAGCPTNAGLLWFSMDATYYFPGAYVQYVQYDGESQESEVLQERRFRGDLISVCRDLDRLASEVSFARPVSDAGLSERVAFEYPPIALHELFMNAVIHRNYEATAPILVNHFPDRIEIQNAGGLYGELTPEQFPQGTAYRNPIVAEAARTLGFVNKYGRGISRVQGELRRNGSPPAEFRLEPNHFLAIVRRRV